MARAMAPGSCFWMRPGLFGQDHTSQLIRPRYLQRLEPLGIQFGVPDHSDDVAAVLVALRLQSFLEGFCADGAGRGPS